MHCDKQNKVFYVLSVPVRNLLSSKNGQCETVRPAITFSLQQ